MLQINQSEGISVIMPTYNQGAFISRAIVSLINQTFTNWELIIINDGCSDNTKETLWRFLKDDRIKYFENKKNIGLGASLNIGLKFSRYSYISYLPSDDIYFKDHLQSLYDQVNKDDQFILIYSGINYNYSVSINSEGYSSAKGKVSGYSLQLVQILHKKTEESWAERKEIVTEDLFRMYWSKLSERGTFVPTGQITCEWINHPHQRHKIIWDKFGGGLNKYRSYYNVSEPINFCSTGYGVVNEEILYKPFRKKIVERKKLKVLLVGDLAYNPERIFALEEHGCDLYGLWTKTPIYSMVGPVPFGNIKSLSANYWKEEIRQIKPDIVYGLLNMMSVPIAHEVLISRTGIPFVWHFKESPFFSRQNGQWKELCELFSLSDGQIYSSSLMKDWLSQFLPLENKLSLILDGDLPKKDMFTGSCSPLLSEQDGEIHTVLAGRPIGIQPENVGILAGQKIHFHFYGETFQTNWAPWVSKTKELAGNYFHIHPNCSQDHWLKEFSKYDAGWLHYHVSANNGEMMKAGWNDMNIPARFTTLALTGVPLIQRDNSGHLVETQTIAAKLDIGLFFKSFEELGRSLKDKKRMIQIRNNIWEHRMKFTFDDHVHNLIDFFKLVIREKECQKI